MLRFCFGYHMRAFTLLDVAARYTDTNTCHHCSKTPRYISRHSSHKQHGALALQILHLCQLFVGLALLLRDQLLHGKPECMDVTVQLLLKDQRRTQTQLSLVREHHLVLSEDSSMASLGKGKILEKTTRVAFAE